MVDFVNNLFGHIVGCLERMVLYSSLLGPLTDNTVRQDGQRL